jgi:hypothetical protein
MTPLKRHYGFELLAWSLQVYFTRSVNWMTIVGTLSITSVTLGIDAISSLTY